MHIADNSILFILIIALVGIGFFFLERNSGAGCYNGGEREAAYSLVKLPIAATACFLILSGNCPSKGREIFREYLFP